MELQFKSETCRCLTAAVREVHSAELTQEVRLTDGMPDIGRVVASWGQIILRGKEWQSDQVCVSGGIMTNSSTTQFLIGVHIRPTYFHIQFTNIFSRNHNFVWNRKICISGIITVL